MLPPEPSPSSALTGTEVEISSAEVVKKVANVKESICNMLRVEVRRFLGVDEAANVLLKIIRASTLCLLYVENVGSSGRGLIVYRIENRNNNGHW